MPISPQVDPEIDPESDEEDEPEQPEPVSRAQEWKHLEALRMYLLQSSQDRTETLKYVAVIERIWKDV
jgi:hypothetical protein